MWRAVYNSGIPGRIVKSVSGSFCACLVRGARFGLFVVTLIPAAWAGDWSGAEQQLARKIVAVTGPGTVSLTVENRSSLGRRDCEIVENGIRASLDQAGIHFVSAEQAAATVAISFSENATSYVWVAQIQQSAAESAVVMVSVTRAGPMITAVRDSMPLSIQKTLLWSQTARILDVMVLEESETPMRIAVLSPENVTFYRWTAGMWEPEQVLAITRAKPWPLDLRGRLVLTQDRFLDVYLPGVHCHTTGSGGMLTMSCREADDPWPLVLPMAGSVASGGGASPNSAPIAGFFASTRNFFTGVVTPGIGKFNAVPKFYSSAFVPRDRYTLWLFAVTDGTVHMVDGMQEQISRLDWGSDITSIKTACGAGWQVLAASATEQDEDSVRAYEFPDRDPVAVSSAIAFRGGISALWTESKGDSAVAIVNERETGNYEAFRLAVACNQ